MSRAFVDEDAGSDEADGMHEIPLPLPPGAKNYMTSEGALRMEDELRRLSEVERPKASGALAAAESADKADYIRRLSEIERRISYLARMKSLLEVVEKPPSLERVVFGLVVRVREEKSLVESGLAARETPNARETLYRIVGVDESDPDRGFISWASPIARALIGKRKGDAAIARLPMEERRLRVVEISYASP